MYEVSFLFIIGVLAHELQNVHDEVISLNLQLNMSEQTVAKLRNENKELIDRWMDSKRKEAEEMNETLQYRSKER